ncbi:hypothetical protein F441_13758 [Phytophthora nicotianae CJ01A1]|uniref:Peptidase S1 domain-containing protein n=6 Tax=Phytophthora nicotianae TaxID=4792 RepID=W2PWG0_PHYN3|nr:hypothetical protein PPTG_14046 [Phytophthora nicotianae INRA-310]ETI40876.1 hypothetical protein F443_13832 [Phytophthora nicotianae P1569]ETK80975.1 hypothetical protein L915_13474 [Phytophthora nicotianae]ETO69561.1 hypothetical protein F444_13874 [Phytophthora nicotianae P1976]ETP10644.1 hypothetical protein F441_13758 [Phytophthora nicotianae CJ01A1]ETP38805.1 hypothetical protein F442_13669 [Phytophthora nicotianae P10297]KUF77014.1 Ovochymase-2 [Phytophthora nicotianae]
MKFVSAFVAALAALAVVSSADSTDAVERRLILGGTTVPKGRKTYYAGMRKTAEGKNFCGGTLISPIHVLTASHCVTYDIRWVSIGSHYNNGTQDGEQIKVVSVMNHPNFTEALKFSNDFVILELEVASTITPAKLAKADDSDFKDGATVTTVGTGRLSEGTTALAGHELQRVDSTLITNEKCAEYGKITVDDSMICVGGQISMGYCDGDSGGPAFIEYSDDDADDVVVGVVSWRNWRDGEVCGRGKSLPMLYSRVSYARSWIDPIRKSSCFE